MSVKGYCPMLPANSVEYSTIYTVMTILQKQMERLSQENSVIRFDKNIYAKAKEIQWRRPDEFKKLIIRMGGFHIALNFLSVIGKRYSDSGFEDILVEADLYGSNTVAKIIKGKSYDRGVRAHKLMLEALLRLKWEAFCQWAAQEREQINTTSVDEALRECNLAIEKEDMHLLGDMLLNMCKEIEVFKDPFNRFCEESEVKSKTFQFSNEYTKMVGTLLRYIRAERVSNWDLHLASVVEMISYKFAYDHTNYARWMSVYLCDMRLLPSSSPSVQMEFEAGSHSVNRSANSFNMVWTDMALEQSENRDTKTLGGIVGFSTNPEAVNRWFLTAHVRASVTRSLKRMCGLDIEEDDSCHKESGLRILARDESDVQKITTLLSTSMKNPFQVTEDEESSLLNIVTGQVPPNEVEDQLLNAQTTGLKYMDEFVDERLV